MTGYDIYQHYEDCNNFADFELLNPEDDPRQLAYGVLGTLVARVNSLVTEPEQIDWETPQGRSALVGKLGPNKVLRENGTTIKAALTLSEAAAIVEESGIMMPLHRNLWTPDDVPPEGMPVFMTGAVANWQDRTAAHVAGLGGIGDVHIAAGNRVMGSTSTERENDNMIDYFTRKGKYPTEAQYAEEYVVPVLEDAGKKVIFRPYKTEDGTALALQHAESKEGAKLRDGFIAARVATGGIQLGIQMRSMIQATHPRFDTPEHPGMYVSTDGIEEDGSLQIAKIETDLADPRHFQNPYTALRQLALTAKLLREVRDEELAIREEQEIEAYHQADRDFRQK